MKSKNIYSKRPCECPALSTKTITEDPGSNYEIKNYERDANLFIYKGFISSFIITLQGMQKMII